MSHREEPAWSAPLGLECSPLPISQEANMWGFYQLRALGPLLSAFTGLRKTAIPRPSSLQQKQVHHQGLKWHCPRMCHRCSPPAVYPSTSVLVSLASYELKDPIRGPDCVRGLARGAWESGDVCSYIFLCLFFFFFWLFLGHSRGMWGFPG